jgi:hypothetical protein
MWSRAGLDEDIGRQVLKVCCVSDGVLSSVVDALTDRLYLQQLQVDEGETNALQLSATLDRELVDSASGSHVLMVAVLSFKAELDHLR